MKIIITVLALYAMPLYSHAQPIISNNEFYTIGDSVSSITGNSQTAMYLAYPASVRIFNSTNNMYSGHLNNNELILTGSFEYGKMYEVVIYNLIGTKIYTAEFTAYGDPVRFDIGKEVVPGIYIVSIMQKNDASSREVIKVIEQ